MSRKAHSAEEAKSATRALSRDDRILGLISAGDEMRAAEIIKLNALIASLHAAHIIFNALCMASLQKWPVKLILCWPCNPIKRALYEMYIEAK